MPSKYAQDRRDRDRSNNHDVPLQPYVLTAAEIPYKVNHAVPPRPTYQQHPKGSSSSTTAASNSNSNFRGSYPPYRQRLVAAALGTTDDPHSSNDSSSAPSSNTTAVSSATSSSSPITSKGKAKSIGPVPVPVPAVPQPAPASLCIPIPPSEPAGFDRSSSYYEFLMVHNAGALPAPGPSYFERRRALWTASPPIPPAPASPSPSRIKLEALLGHPGAVESEEVWRVGLKNVWKGLLGGNQLRHRLPLDIVLKILQAGWLRDGTWPEGMVAPAWDQPMQTPSPAPPPDSSHPQPHSQSQPQRTQQQHERDQQRRVHEQEAYAAALHARASAEQGSGAAQIMHMQAYAMMGMGLGGGIPLGYSPSSGDAPEEGYYTMPYAYAEPTPPGSDGAPAEGDRRREGEEGPPLTPACAVQDLQSEMDTEDEMEEEDGVEDDGRMEGVVQTGDGRHEGG